MKPNGVPEPPQGCPITPRVTSIRRVRELDIADFELPIDDLMLCELLPFAHSTDGDGTQWIAVRVTVDLPGTPASVEECGWLPLPELNRLPNLRDLIRQAPDDLASINSILNLERAIKRRFRRQPSARTRLEVNPGDGVALLTAWRDGRRPVLRTLAFIEWVLPHVPEIDEGYVVRAVQILRERTLQRRHREEVIAALDRLVRIVDGWTDWPTPPELEASNPFPEGYFDGIDFEDLFGDEDPEDPI
jgi:hypothetical protein